MKEFDTCFTSLSFFDGKYELFKAEIGYGASRISRPVSIASHALLTTDGLVVLDTKQVGQNLHIIVPICSLMLGLAV